MQWDELLARARDRLPVMPATGPGEGPFRRALAEAHSHAADLRCVTRLLAAAPDALGPEVATPRLEVTLLGDFRVTVNGREIPAAAWPRERVRHLLGYLVLQRGPWLTVDAVTDALWPQLGGQSAAAGFYVTLHALRRLLEPALTHGRESRFVESRRGLVRLAPAVEVQLDVDQFRAACRQAEAAWAAGRREAAEQSWAEAVGLYRGPLMPDDRQSDWSALEREQCARTYLQALVGIAGAALAGRRFQEALSAARRALADDPYDEEACAIALQALSGLGHRLEALRLYQGYCRVLHRDLQAVPGHTLAGIAAHLGEWERKPEVRREPSCSPT